MKKRIDRFLGITIIILLFSSCISRSNINSNTYYCECDSINDFSEPLNLSSDTQGNLISGVNKVQFKHCISISKNELHKFSKILYPLLLNNKKKIGYIIKYPEKINYITTDFKNEETLFDFYSNKSTWTLKYGYFYNYQVTRGKSFNNSDSIFIFNFKYLGRTISESIYFKKFETTNNNIISIEFSNGIKCNCFGNTSKLTKN